MSELTTIENSNITPITEMPPAAEGFSSASLVLSNDAMDSVIRIADLMASGRTTIPKHLQGSQGDCFAVSLQAMQWGMNPFAVAQKTHLVNGTLGYEAQLVIAVLNSSPALATRLNFEWSDNWVGVNGKTDKSPDRWCRVWATLKGETEPRVLEVSMAQVGDTRNSPNWATDPRQQLAYLAAKRWGRLHAPDVILGVYTPDELQDGSAIASMPPPRKPAEIAAAALPQPAERTDELNNIIFNLEMVAKSEGATALAEEWSMLTKEQRKAIGQDELKRLKELAGEGRANEGGDGDE
ncbi:hypothetical protein CR3_4306 [Cupriavidus gilardii CR3]|nr:RecT family recombinase [Cupriavidus gilardii]ALD93488.1 hypothetical protein CR3_4306 [Cupriavidus gilardii CR3]